MYVEDLDLRLDDEYARVHGKGGTVRPVADAEIRAARRRRGRSAS